MGFHLSHLAGTRINKVILKQARALTRIIHRERKSPTLRHKKVWHKKRKHRVDQEG